VGDDLRLGGERVRRVRARVALAENQILALAEAHRGRRDADGEDQRRDDGGAAGEGEGKPLHTSRDTTGTTELRAAKALSYRQRLRNKLRNFALTLARLLLRVDRDREVEVKGSPDDPVLLDRVRGRIALARRGALRAADVAELDVGRQDLQQARRHVRAGT